MPKRKFTYDEILFSILMYEYEETKEKMNRSEAAIKRKLKYYEKGPYSQARVNRMRRFKTEMHDEIYKDKKSKYFLGVKGRFVGLDDFDRERMIKDYAKKHPGISKKNIRNFLRFAIYIYYLR